MPAISATDNSFLALSFIGKGEKYRDVPDFVQAAFESLSTPPGIIDTIILPKTSISVLALVAYSLPVETPVEPLPDPLSYFIKQDPHPTNSASILLLKSLPIPPQIVLERIIRQAGQAWLDGFKSIVYSHTGHVHRFPFWVLCYWKQVSELLPARHAWTLADRYLTTLQKKTSEVTRRAADEFRALLHALPWHGSIHGFSDTDPVYRQADFTSEKWLADIHETFMLEELQRQIAAIPEFGTQQVVTNIWISTKIRIAYEHRDVTEYPSPHRTELAELGADLASGAKSRLGMIWFIKHSHWCSMDINASQRTIRYGDPEGDEAPLWLCEATDWWLSKHIEGKFEWGMDEKLVNVVGEDDFGPPEADVDLDAPELDDILADTPRISKAPVRATEVVMDEDTVLEGEDAVFDWT
jgi:hypothetical protein